VSALLILLASLILMVTPAWSMASARQASAPYRFALGALLFIASTHAFAQAVPDAAAMYRRLVESAVTDYWPVDGSSAQLAAQIHQESLWRPKAASRAGAIGMAQFMPSTARWIATQFPRELGAFDPWDPAQAIRGAALYDRWLYDRVAGTDECERWAFALAAYNGGLGWVQRDKQHAQAHGFDSRRWWDHVERAGDPRRASFNLAENRAYVQRILRVLTPIYVDAGWPGRAVCA